MTRAFIVAFAAIAFVLYAWVAALHTTRSDAAEPAVDAELRLQDSARSACEATHGTFTSGYFNGGAVWWCEETGR